VYLYTIFVLVDSCIKDVDKK